LKRVTDTAINFSVWIQVADFVRPDQCASATLITRRPRSTWPNMSVLRTSIQ
jgi:hypothetical protein